MALSREATRDVISVMDQYIRYYNERNVERVLDLFSKTVSGFGTGKDEIVMNFAQFKERIRAELDPANAIHLSMKVLATGGELPVAWITGFCLLEGSIGGKQIHMDGRMTLVLANRGGRWLFEQIHFSVPDI